MPEIPPHAALYSIRHKMLVQSKRKESPTKFDCDGQNRHFPPTTNGQMIKIKWTDNKPTTNLNLPHVDCPIIQN
eukprot:scaffold254389_cov31-Prasinocladus_malaysianus.AAC.1